MMFFAIVPKPDVPEYCYHQYLWAYFKKDKGEQRPFLFRVMTDAIVMLSREKQSCPSVAIADRITAGLALQFDVLCNPARSQLIDSEKTKKRRVPYKTNAERHDWFKRRIGEAADSRFVQVFDRPQRRFKKGDGNKIIIDECVIRGVVYINDRSEFIDILLNGVGGRGAWGYGLMLLPEVMTC